MSDDEYLAQSAETRAVLLREHVERQAAGDFANRCYWHRHIKENLVSQKLGITSNATMFRTVSMDDPKIVLPSGKRTDQLGVEELRQEMKKLPIPNISETSGKMVLCRQLQDYVTSITKICWPEQTEKESQ